MTAGAFYVIQLAPDVAPQRVKLGWTSDLGARLAAHRCAAPTASLVRSWPCARGWEAAAIQAAVAAEGCTGLSREVFDVDSVSQLVERAGQFFLNRAVPAAAEDDGLLSIAEIAGWLQLSPKTIGAWLRSGHLAGRRRPDVECLIDAGAASPKLLAAISRPFRQNRRTPHAEARHDPQAASHRRALVRPVAWQKGC